MRAPILIAIALAASGGVAQAQLFSSDYTEDRSASIAISGATSIRIVGLAGDLKIQGRKGLAQARATGKARASSRDLLGEIKLVAERVGNEVVVRADIPEHRGMNWRSEQSLDMVVEVPSGLPLRVEDGSGDTEIRGVEAVDVKDGSGDLLIEDAGGVVVDDGSGDIEIRGVKGDVRVNDGSGDITVTNVTGTLTVESDGSGDIEASGISGSVVVRSDGSGEIAVHDVGGDFDVGHKGSGDVSYERVKGKVSIPDRKRHRHGDDDDPL